VTANAQDSTVSLLVGNGDGTFQGARTFPVGPNPESLAVGHLRGDGRLDVVTGNEPVGDGSLSVLQGNGDGTFQPAVTLGLGSAGGRPAPRSVAVADLTNNGHLDLVSANDSDDGGTVSVYLGNGDGTFGPAVTYPVQPVSEQVPLSNPLSVVAGDFTGGGHPDLVVSNAAFLQGGGGGLSQLFLLPGRGDGTFGTPVALDSGNLPLNMTAADFNGDNNLDLAVVNTGGGDVSVLLGNGDGTFNTAPEFAARPGAVAVATGDLRGLGVADLVTANSRDNSVSVLLGNGDGSFRGAVSYPVGRGPDAVAVGDFAGDGIPDIVTGNLLDGTLSVLVGNGDGTFQPARTVTTGIPFFAPFDLAAVPQRDGTLDLAVSYEGIGGAAGLLVLAGNPDGSFREVQNLLSGAFTLPEHLAVADLNGDGVPDLVQAAGMNTAGQPGVVIVYLGNGDGTFNFIGSSMTGQNTTTGVAVGDFNGDGIPDVVATNFLDHSVTVFLGHGDGTLGLPRRIEAGQNSRSVLVGDFTGNGVADIALANSTANTVSVVLGNGDGTFQPEVRYLAGAGTNAVVAADFNGDGALDLAAANSVSGSVSVLLNRNDGGRRAPPTGGALARNPAAAADATLARALVGVVGPARAQQAVDEIWSGDWFALSRF
jgi:hypothetical protein